jgi:hypothetical protein
MRPLHILAHYYKPLREHCPMQFGDHPSSLKNRTALRHCLYSLLLFNLSSIFKGILMKSLLIKLTVGTSLLGASLGAWAAGACCVAGALCCMGAMPCCM